VKPGIAWVKGIGRGAGYRLFTEFKEIRHRKKPDEVVINIGDRKFKIQRDDVRRWPS